jgi:hypothetical protein
LGVRQRLGVGLPDRGRTKSQIQALDRTAPMLAMQPGLPERRTHDYVRHGTTTLFAALEIATGQVTAACQPRHRHQEFLRFLKQVTRAYPDVQLHLVMDNYAPQTRRDPRLADGDSSIAYPVAVPATSAVLPR